MYISYFYQVVYSHTVVTANKVGLLIMVGYIWQVLYMINVFIFTNDVE